MNIKQIKILNYKNLIDINISLDSQVVCLVGLNGSGKTNFIDAVYFLSNTRSYFNHIDSLNANYKADNFFLDGKFEKNNSLDNISAYYSNNDGKIVKINDKKYKRFSDHYGLFPVVIITPNDINLIIDGSEYRRNFIDSIISIFDRQYLENLINYKKILQQRNNLLKKFAQNQYFDKSLLEIFDYKLISLNPAIHERRNNFLNEFIPLFNQYYQKIAQTEENIDIKYVSQISEDKIENLFNKSLNSDLAAQHTTVGVHKDDLLFTINNMQVKKHASQGQQKTFLIALKFAEAFFINKILNISPILLLDDIFDKLDSRRIENIVNLFSFESFGQIFITHTDNNILHNILNLNGLKFKYYKVDNGKIIPID